MIRDLITWLETDASLQTLLNGNAGNKKFFPIMTKPSGETTPYVRYFSSSEGSGDNVLEESMVTLNVIGEDFDECAAISYRLSELLDVWEGLTVPSTRFYIYYSRKVAGSDSAEEDTNLYVLSRIFHIKYKRKTGG